MVFEDPVLQSRRRAIVLWLFGVSAMVFVMIILGGLTRLTFSGLSMVEWKPLTGWIPPITLLQWQAVFEKYQQFPEYRELNFGMTLAEFKFIFWMEYVHRVWGRLIGIAFLVPFVMFFVRGWLPGRLIPKLLLMLVLGGLQGGLGWYMVKSGLVDRPDVSPYRLAAHFGLALVIYGYMIWAVLGIIAPEPHDEHGDELRGLRGHTVGTLALIFVAAVSGSFVAGTGAGFAYNTFPLMEGAWLPAGLYDAEPFHVNLFEDITTVQFNHRILAIAVLAATAALWWRSRRHDLASRARLAVNAALAMALVQVALGISTLLLVVPVPLAVVHQGGAVVLFTLVLWGSHELRSAY